VLPEDIDTFPWAGHLGLKLLPQLVEKLDAETSTLIFTNTRSQAERWFQALCMIRPHWETVMALHHGSIDKASRTAIEIGLKQGDLKLVVCTSSLDLGVDFAPVERVVQIGSAKGIARLIQRAGRSGHRPGAIAKVIYVPTHALELAEISAIRQALQKGEIEARQALDKPFDVLSQHLVTCAAGDGFDVESMYNEIITAYSYRDLSSEEFRWVLTFVEHGGTTLSAYPQYHKVVHQNGYVKMADDRMAKLHRMSIGTITSDTAIKIAYQTGGGLGTIEEYFIAKLKPGDVFVFAGRQLELVRMRGMTAYVKKASKKAKLTPAWIGGQLPISSSLSAYLRQRLADTRQDIDAELQTLEPILKAQQALSCLPQSDQLLIEHLSSREGQHLFVYPFEGRLVHEGLAALLCYRLSQTQPMTLTFSVNDYGLEILASKDIDLESMATQELFNRETLSADIRASLNLSELAKRQFRGIAQVAGLVFQGYPGSRKTGRQLQTSSSLLYDVFQQHDPDNLLLQQAEREVLAQQLETRRLRELLERLNTQQIVQHKLSRPTPLAFPLMIERLSARLSNESLLDRIARMKAYWSKRG
jgi:ATP-dependent Lhr-like helicase